MSLRRRARSLMRGTGLSYQQALEKLRELGKAPAALRAQTGWPLAECDLHLARKGKIEVITVEPRTRAELACQQLLHTSSARAVVLVDGWRVLASAGPSDSRFLFHPMLLMQRMERLPKQRKIFEIGGGVSALCVAVKRLHLIVVYDESVSTMLLDKRVEKAVEYLAALMEDDPLLAPPESGGSGSGGLSSVAWESVEIWTKKKS